MCEMCDNPGMTKDQALTRMAERMTRCGWVIQGVEESGPHPPWAYTVGLTPRGLPELVVTGLPWEVSGEILNDWAGYTMDRATIGPGEHLRLTNGPGIELFEVVEVAEPSAHLLTACALFGDARVRALQLVWADDRGIWPWHRAFRRHQPVLGPRIAPAATARIRGRSRTT